MKLKRTATKLSLIWYTKPMDTGLTMNFHALAPLKYKRAVVAGLVHRIVRSCSSWLNVHENFVRAKTILENNQYQPYFYEPIIAETLRKIVEIR